MFSYTSWVTLSSASHAFARKACHLHSPKTSSSSSRSSFTRVTSVKSLVGILTSDGRRIIIKKSFSRSKCEMKITQDQDVKFRENLEKSQERRFLMSFFLSSKIKPKFVWRKSISSSTFIKKDMAEVEWQTKFRYNGPSKIVTLWPRVAV